ncbi:MAG: hypothetical protein SGILL_004701 [Bacillariaceae sp.]
MKYILPFLALVAVRSASIGSSDQTIFATRKPQQSTVEIVNDSGKTLVVEWIHPLTGEATKLYNGLISGESTVFNTYVNHTFALHEEDCDADADNEIESCPVRFLTVGESDGQVARVQRGLTISFSKHDEATRLESNGVVLECKEQARKNVASGIDPGKAMEDLARCLNENTAKAFQKKNDKIAGERQSRLAISARMENYTCADSDRESSEPVETHEWKHDNVTRKVLVMHNRQASQIHVLEDFVSAEECEAIKEAAAPKLHRGTVADGSGGHKLSDSRKAWQAGIQVPWHKESQGNPIAGVVRRLYDYTNHAVGYNLTVEGQEDLMSIQYFGKGKASTEAPDNYRPHCDGACDGLPHKAGGRVATMVMYCDVPDLGGGTNFQNSNVFVKPKQYAAAFFSYYDTETGNMENGFTSHSGCPVIEGTKRIAVHWMRIGVDEKNSWDTFNTLTIKKEGEDC